MDGKKSKPEEKPGKKKASAASGGAEDQELEALLNGACMISKGKTSWAEPDLCEKLRKKCKLLIEMVFVLLKKESGHYLWQNLIVLTRAIIPLRNDKFRCECSINCITNPCFTLVRVYEQSGNSLHRFHK